MRRWTKFRSISLTLPIRPWLSHAWRNLTDSAKPPVSPPSLSILKKGGEKCDLSDPKYFLDRYADLPQTKSKYPLPSFLPKSLETGGFTLPTPIQRHTIPLTLQGHDLIGLAPTGTGKTLAFAIPAFMRADPEIKTCQCVMICPTRELAQQMHTVFVRLAKNSNIRVAMAHGGRGNWEIQAEEAYQAQILIATPGRLNDFVQCRVVNFRNCCFVVIDEADRLLDMGFAPQIEQILNFYQSCETKPQTLMWSATWDGKVQELADRYISDDFYMVSAGAHETGHTINPLITQNFHFLGDMGSPGRLDALLQLYKDKVIQREEKVLLFVERKITASALYEQFMERLGSLFSLAPNFVDCVHGDRSQTERDQAVRRFRSDTTNVLVATDVVSRGIDIPNVNHVVNFEMPPHFESYVHRIGRTGRMGRKGSSHSLVHIQSDVMISPQLEDYLIHSSIKVPEALRKMAILGRQIRERREREQEKRKEEGGNGFASDRRNTDPRFGEDEMRNVMEDRPRNVNQNFFRDRQFSSPDRPFQRRTSSFRGPHHAEGSRDWTRNERNRMGAPNIVTSLPIFILSFHFLRPSCVLRGPGSTFSPLFACKKG